MICGDGSHVGVFVLVIFGIFDDVQDPRGVVFLIIHLYYDFIVYTHLNKFWHPGGRDEEHHDRAGEVPLHADNVAGRRLERADDQERVDQDSEAVPRLVVVRHLHPGLGVGHFVLHADLLQLVVGAAVLFPQEPAAELPQAGPVRVELLHRTNHHPLISREASNRKT